MDLDKLLLNELVESKYDEYRHILEELNVFNVINDYEKNNDDVYVNDYSYIKSKRLVEMMENAICFLHCALELRELKGKYEYLDKEIDTLMEYYDKNKIGNYELINKCKRVENKDGLINEQGITELDKE